MIIIIALCVIVEGRENRQGETMTLKAVEDLLSCGTWSMISRPINRILSLQSKSHIFKNNLIMPKTWLWSRVNIIISMIDWDVYMKPVSRRLMQVQSHLLIFIGAYTLYSRSINSSLAACLMFSVISTAICRCRRHGKCIFCLVNKIKDEVDLALMGK